MSFSSNSWQEGKEAHFPKCQTIPFNTHLALHCLIELFLRDAYYFFCLCYFSKGLLHVFLLVSRISQKKESHNRFPAGLGLLDSIWPLPHHLTK